MNKDRIEFLIAELLKEIGEDPSRPGLLETPKRVSNMYTELLSYNKEKPRIMVVPNGEDGVHYDEMLTDSGYFFSLCEHHMVPFFGRYYYGYIPDKLVLGASKIGRVIDYYAGRLQIAERLVNQVVTCLGEAASPVGQILVMDARHLCKEMRGLRKWDSPYAAQAVRGCFKNNEGGCKDEFMARIPKIGFGH